MLDWLDANFVGKTTPQGDVIARYATATEVAELFYRWEAEHPGMSSFSWEQGQPYPYTYADMPILLRDAEYDRALDLGAALAAHRFTRQSGGPIYVLWSWDGEQVVDFSAQIAGQLQVHDGKGNHTTADARALIVTEEPILVEAATR